MTRSTRHRPPRTPAPRTPRSAAVGARVVASALGMATALLMGGAAWAQSFDIEVRGPEPARGVLERHLDLYRYQEVADLDESELGRLMALAEDDARRLLGTLGLFAPVLDIHREPGARPRVVVDVQPGPQTVVREVDMAFEGDIATSPEADAIAQREAIRSQWALAPGQPFTQQAWDEAKARALRQLVARRYPAGRLGFTEADIDAGQARARLGLRVDSGPLFRLGPLRVTGLSRYDPVLVPRLSRLTVGEIFDQDRITRAQLRLSGSGYFDSAFIFVDPEGNPAAAPVQVALREAPLQRVRLGVGVATDSGVRTSIEHTHNRVPGIDWRAVTQLQLDRKQPFAQTEWTDIPDEGGWRWSVLGRVERLTDQDLDTRAQRLRVGRFRSDDRIDRNVYVQYDRAKVSSDSSASLPPENVGQGSSISVNYVWTRRDFNTLPSPTQGQGLAIELGGGVTLGGDNRPFQRTVVRWLRLQPLERGRVQFRAEGGAVVARDDARVPATQLFRTGGDTTVRGYALREIGVTQPNGQIAPGRYLAVGSIEWQRPRMSSGGTPSMLENTAFIDAGAVADRVGELKASVGIGTGIRWRSPVGPVEGAIAYGVQARRFRLHLSVGFQF